MSFQMEENESSFDQLVIESERERILNQVLNTITSRRSKAIKLRYIEGYTFKEIGAAFGVSVTRAKQIVDAGIRQLQHPRRKEKLEDLL